MRYLSLIAAVSAACHTVCAAALPTATTLAVTSGAGPVTTVAAGSVVALTATVNAGSTPVIVGQVNFCDASVSSCTDIHLLGTSQLTAAGTAMLRFRPGIGNHSYKAVFAGTNNNAGSSSSVSALSVTGTTGTLASTSTIAETGGWGNYALTATVTESGGTIPPTGAVSFLDTSNGNVALATPTLGAAVPGVDWPNPQQLITGSVSEAVAIGDFNGDGIPDLAVAPGTPQQPLAILLGNANGSYTTAPALSFYAYSLGPIVVADFNGDGKQDLAALTVNSNTVTVLLGNGDGTFNLVASSPAIASSSKQIAVGDFNGDGIPDLVVTDFLSSSLSIFLGNGDGTFTATPAGPVASNSPNAVVVGDFNQDGKLDLAVSDTYADTLSILLGHGDGTFSASTSLHSGSDDSPLATADFNGDGKLDLVVGVSGAGGVNDSVTILAGNGDGTFTAPPAGQAVSSTSIGSINVGDFNEDGIPDLALTDNISGALTIFLASGSGSFIPFSTILPASSYHQFFYAVGDLNGDGRSDLVIGDQDGGPLKDYLTQPTETATATVTLTLTSAGRHLVNGSYSGDSNYTPSVSSTLPLWGVPPVTATTLSVSSGGSPVTSVVPGTAVALTATVAAGASPVTAGQVNFCDASATECTDIHLLATVTLKNNGTATFPFVPGAGTHSYKAVFVEDGFGMSSASAPSTLTVGPAKNPVYTDTTAITDGGSPGDYSLTATVVGYGGTAPPTGNISFLDTSFANTSLATATLGPATAGLGWRISQTPAVSNSIVSQVTGDFNGDGIPDLALFSVTESVAGSFTIFFGKGDGTFTTGPTTQTTIAYGINYSMVAQDLNGDGKTDLAILSYTSAENVTTFLGNGDGTFAAPVNVAINQPSQGGDGVPGSLIAADFNGDGKIDLAAAGDYIAQGGANILLGNGDGTFTPTTSLQFPLNFNLVASGDFNGDGIPDLVATQYFDPGGAYIFLGKGDGTFTATATTIATTRFVTSIVVGDFNQDGKPDLAFGYSSELQVFLGNGDGTFTQGTGSPLNGTGGLTAGDFNHDGKLDLAGIDNYNNLIDLFLGVGDGTFSPASTTPVVSQATPFSIVAADFNEDGVPDLALLTINQLTASILLTEPTETASASVNGIAPVGAGTHNVLASYAGDANYSPTVSATIPLTAGLAPVTFSPAAGTYSSTQTITLTETVPGATIYYSLTGTINTNGFVPYTAPISLAVGGHELLQAYATETGYQQSSYAAAMYYLNLPALAPPVLSPAGGSYAGAQTVTISDSVVGATIYYTTNGSVPTPSSAKYTGAITVNSSETISAIAVANGYAVSARATAQYLIGSSRSSFIYTLAGNGSAGYSGDSGQATTAQLNQPNASALDAAGNLYFTDSQNNVVRKVAAGTGVITTVAGVGTYGYSGDNGPATSAQLGYPTGLAVDNAGNLYIGDSGNYVVRKVASNGVITTIAGNGTAGSSGDGGPATSAEMYFPAGVAIDNAGNLYIADYSYSRIREVSVKTGVITTVAGTGQPGYSGDGGAATAAQLYSPFAVTTDSGGNLYIADSFNNVIRKVDAANGVISTVAGNGYGAGANGNGGYTGDGGPATSAELNRPFGVAVDSAGNLYIADANNLVIRMVAAASGIISTVAGDGSACISTGGDGGPATSAGFCYPSGVTADGAGNLYVADDRTPRIRQVRVSSFPPTAQTAAPTFNIPPGTYAGPQTVTVSDSTPGAAIYVTLDGSTPGTAGIGYLGPITVSGGMTIKAIAVAPGLIASAPATASYAITAEPTAVITTVAGDGVSGFSSGGGSPGGAQLGSLAGVAVDHSGNLFFADTTNDVVWELTAKTGLISIVAGLGQPGIGGNSGLVNNVQLNGPAGVAADGTGNLFIADTGNNVVWKVAAGTGLITVYAGQESSTLSTNLGDGGPAASARLVEPSGLAVDSAGNLYIADSGDGLIRFVSASTGVITSVAGVGPAVGGSNADGIPATSASILLPGALALDGNGNLYIALPIYGRVRKVTLSTGLITTVAGNGDSFGSSGDGGPALKAEIFPQGLAADSAGNLYLSDPAEIRTVSAATGIISNFAGNRYFGYSGDGGSATVAEVANPQGIAFDTSGNLYIADQINYRVREVFSSAHAFVTPGITVTPSATSITTAQPLTVIVAVNQGTGKSTPTGSITLASGNYSVQQNLANGTATFNLAPGSLPVGANTLTATFAPDNASAGTYSVASQTATVTVTTTTITVVPLLVTVPTPPPVAPGSAATVTATFSAGSTYSGTLHLTCALTGSPANAQSVPTCTLNPASVVVAAGGKATTLVTVNTTAASSGNAFNSWGGGGVLALVLLFVAPSLRRRKTTLLLIACAIAIIGCGGGSTASSAPPPTPTPATTPGAYTFLLTATDASNAKVTASANLTVTVE